MSLLVSLTTKIFPISLGLSVNYIKGIPRRLIFLNIRFLNFIFVGISSKGYLARDIKQGISSKGYLARDTKQGICCDSIATALRQPQET
jgi:hypothetical protein